MTKSHLLFTARHGNCCRAGVRPLSFVERYDVLIALVPVVGVTIANGVRPQAPPEETVVLL